MIHFFRTYKYTLGFFLSILIAFTLLFAGIFETIVFHLTQYGIFGGLIAGLLFPFTFTAASAGIFLVELGRFYNPFLIAVIAGLGAMIADLIMFRFLKEGIVDEIKLIIQSILPIPTLKKLENITEKKVWLWGIPFLASVLIASPLPDEIGIALFGVVNFRPRYLSLLSYILNTLGIFALVFLGFSIGQ